MPVLLHLHRMQMLLLISSKVLLLLLVVLLLKLELTVMQGIRNLEYLWMLDLLVRRLGATRRAQGADAAVGSCKEWLCVFTDDRDTLAWFGAKPTKRELMMDSSSCEIANDYHTQRTPSANSKTASRIKNVPLFHHHPRTARPQGAREGFLVLHR